jgi:hypothetical protein
MKTERINYKSMSGRRIMRENNRERRKDTLVLTNDFTDHGVTLFPSVQVSRIRCSDISFLLKYHEVCVCVLKKTMSIQNFFLRTLTEEYNYTNCVFRLSSEK